MHAVVTGLVQGVGFRWFVVRTAEPLTLTGTVRNTLTGEVEVVAEGERPALDLLLAALRQGPRSASVKRVRVEWGAATGEFRSFSIH